jgi:hypothetical protein
MTTIRRNAFKKISAILATTKGVIGDSSRMDMSDCFDTTYFVSDAATALQWLKDNQHGASVMMHRDYLEISGPYYFCDSFKAYFTEEAFKRDKADLVDKYAA